MKAQKRLLVFIVLVLMAVWTNAARAWANDLQPTSGLAIREPGVQLGLLEAAQSFWNKQLQSGITLSYLVQRRCDCSGPRDLLVDVESGEITRVSDFPSGTIRYTQGQHDKQIWGKSLPNAVALNEILEELITIVQAKPAKELELRGQILWPLSLDVRTAGLFPHEEYGYSIRIYQPSQF